MCSDCSIQSLLFAHVSALQVVQCLVFARLFCLVMEDYANIFGSIKGNSFATMYRCYVVKQMVNTTTYTIELWMHLRGLLSTQEATCRVIASCDSYASFVLSNLPRATITQYCTLWCLPFVKLRTI